MSWLELRAMCEDIASRREWLQSLREGDIVTVSYPQWNPPHISCARGCTVMVSTVGNVVTVKPKRVEVTWRQGSDKRQAVFSLMTGKRWYFTDYEIRPREIDAAVRCHADKDGDCIWSECPQSRDGEPMKSGRHCPLDAEDNEDE